jgi:hypothetical protein
MEPAGSFSVLAQSFIQSPSERCHCAACIEVDKKGGGFRTGALNRTRRLSRDLFAMKPCNVYPGPCEII